MLENQIVGVSRMKTSSVSNCSLMTWALAGVYNRPLGIALPAIKLSANIQAFTYLPQVEASSGNPNGLQPRGQGMVRSDSVVRASLARVNELPIDMIRLATREDCITV